MGHSLISRPPTFHLVARRTSMGERGTIEQRVGGAVLSDVLSNALVSPGKGVPQGVFGRPRPGGAGGLARARIVPLTRGLPVPGPGSSNCAGQARAACAGFCSLNFRRASNRASSTVVVFHEFRLVKPILEERTSPCA